MPRNKQLPDWSPAGRTQRRTSRRRTTFAGVVGPKRAKAYADELIARDAASARRRRRMSSGGWAELAAYLTNQRPFK